jgi:aminocarboxymuconate-semialdehyde decarboxylase
MNFIGNDKICLGSDYPFPLGKLQPGRLIEKADLKKKLKRKLLWRNAFEWLGMDEKSFRKKNECCNPPFKKKIPLKELQTIPGVGKSIAKDLYNIGIRKISDLQKCQS